MNNFDIAVIGGGPGGYVAADQAAQHGKRVVLFEERDLGGTCLNRGCIPTKALLKSAEAYRSATNSANLGVNAAQVTFDFTAAHEHKAHVVSALREGVGTLMKKSGVHVVAAHATITGANTIEAAGVTYTAANTIVATGSAPATPPIEGIGLPGVYNSDDLLADSAPDLHSIIIVGGGVIGIEFASMYAALGVQVTIVEAAERILPPFDKEIAQRISSVLKQQGVAINTKCFVSQFAGTPGNMQVTFKDKNEEVHTVTAEGALVAVGRTPSTKGLFAEAVQPELSRGALVVDEAGQTSIPGIYAIGDVRAGGIQLAHAASAQAENVVATICGTAPSVNENLVPSCVYSTPEIAQVGLTEAEAKEAGIDYARGKALASANGKCLIEGATTGMAKILAEKGTGKIIGAQLVCPHATDMIAEVALAMQAGLAVHDLAATIHPHPTVSEMVREAALTLVR